jgi:hypothetical protein
MSIELQRSGLGKRRGNSFGSKDFDGKPRIK